MDLRDKIGKLIALLLVFAMLGVVAISRVDQARLEDQLDDAHVSIVNLKAKIQDLEDQIIPLQWTFEFEGLVFICSDPESDGTYACST